MAKTTFDTDELSGAAATLKRTAASLGGIGGSVSAAARELTGIPQAAALASDTVSLFSDVSAIAGDLEGMADEIVRVVAEHTVRIQSSPPPSPPLGSVPASWRSPAQHLQSWLQRHLPSRPVQAPDQPEP